MNKLKAGQVYEYLSFSGKNIEILIIKEDDDFSCSEYTFRALDLDDFTLWNEVDDGILESLNNIGAKLKQ